MKVDSIIIKSKLFGPSKGTILRNRVAEFTTGGFQDGFLSPQNVDQYKEEFLLVKEDSRELKHVALEYYGTISVASFTFEEVQAVTYTTEPAALQVHLKMQGASYSLGGALIGGVGGLLIGSLIDGVLGSVKERKLRRNYDFKLSFLFRLADGSERIVHTLDNPEGYDMTESRFREAAQLNLQAMANHIQTMKKHLGDKIVST